MLSLFALAAWLIITIVALEICRRQRAWRETWRNGTTRNILLTSCAAMVGAVCLEQSFSMFRVLGVMPLWLIFLTPIGSATVWLGIAGAWPIEGTGRNTGWRRIVECLVVISCCLGITVISGRIFGWRIAGGFMPVAIEHPPHPSVVVPWALFYYFAGAAIEELFFRGVLLRWLRWETRKWRYGSLLAILLSSVVFYLGHGSSFSWVRLGQVILMGSGLAWISVRHGLWAAVWSHWAFNIALSVV